MESFNWFATYFRTCQTLDGRAERVPSGRWNGRPALILTPQWRDGGPTPSISFPWLEQPKYYVNLNYTERRTWRRILSGLSISAIAEEEGVARATIYARIQGNRFGRGGMIGKNFWVLLWWRLRQRGAAGAQ